jgi:hypothetical protein
LVDSQIESGKELIQALAADGFGVTVAFWAQESEDGLWFLYIASPVVDDRGLAESYRIVQRKIRSMPNLWLDSFDVKLIGDSEPIARDALKFRGNYRGATQIGSRQLGDIAIDRAYIYPAITVGAAS